MRDIGKKLLNTSPLLIIAIGTIFVLISALIAPDEYSVSVSRGWSFFAKLFNALGISLYVYVLVEGIWRLDKPQEDVQNPISDAIELIRSNIKDDTKKIVDECFNNDSRLHVENLNNDAINHILLSLALKNKVDAALLAVPELEDYASTVVKSITHSLWGFQIYDVSETNFDVSYDNSVGKVLIENHSTIYIKRFGEQPFQIRGQFDENDSIPTDIELSFDGKELLVKDTDYRVQIIEEDNNTLFNCGWEIKFLNDCWKRHQQIKVSYTNKYHEFDHWTNIAWVTSHPVRHMTTNVTCSDDIQMKDWAEITDKNHTISMKLTRGDRTRIKITSHNWLMPGHGYSLVLSNTQSFSGDSNSGSKGDEEGSKINTD